MRKKYTYHFFGIAMLCLFMLSSEFSFGQWTLDVMGTVKKEETKKRMEGSTITIKRNGSVWKTLTPEENGKFEASLLPDAIYIIEFSKPGHVTKKIELSTKNVPPDDAKYGFDFPMEINLFEEIEGLDVSILKQPIAKVAFNPATGYMDYDADYTKSIQKELDRLKKELEERLKQKEAERKLKQKDYDAAIAAGDKAFNLEKWTEAKPFYEKAAAIFPDESYPGFQLGLISDNLAGLEEANKRYAAAIERADAAFKAREWDKAITNYESASVIKVKEQYPKDKIKEVNDIIANEKKVNEEYTELISKADNSFNEADYDRAKENYTKASALKTYETYPQDKLKEIEKLLAELAEKEKGYKDALAEADIQFKANEYEKSIENYNKALGFKPDQQYPKDKIAEAQNLIAERAKLKDDYDKYIKDADAALVQKNYPDAKSYYQEALRLLAKEQYPKDKIAEIDALIAAAEKLEEDYKTAISDGDRAFGREEYDPAKAAYEKALSFKADEQYPKDKIAEIKKLLEELAAKKAAEEAAALAQKALDDKYNGFIQSADAAFSSKDYEKAKQNYTSALGVKEDEQYPKDKLDEIKNILAELARKKEEAENAKLAQKELDEKYNGLITKADKSLASKSYDDAIANYRAASDVKPSEQYPKDKLKEIDELLATLQKQKEEQALAAESERKKREYFDALIAEADGELTNKNYTDAESKYNQALTVIPGEKYPQDKIQEIKDILAKIQAEKDNALMAQKELDEKYKKLIIEADNGFNSKNYSLATNKYKAALNVKNSEVYPQDQLDKIKDILDEIAQKEAEIQLTNNALKQKQERYNTFIKLADEDLSKKRYDKAISNYEQALGIMPDKTYPKEKIDEIKGILAVIAEQEKNDKDAAMAEKEKRASYDQLIYDGDRAMSSKDYKKAQGKFNAALNLYPDEKYPSDKLAEILELLKQPVEEPEPVVVTNNTNPGSRAKISDAKEREIEAKMAALLNRVNANKAKALDKDKERFERDEEIRISGGVSRTNEADDQINRYSDDIIEQAERGNKYHIENGNMLDATTELLEKAEEDRIKNADKRREEANKDNEDYVFHELKFKKEQDELSKEKMINYDEYVNDVTEAKLVMQERGDKAREDNRKDLIKLKEDTEKSNKLAKERSIELELDVQKYKEELANEEEIRITAAIDRTGKNQDDIDEMVKERNEMKAEKMVYYKLNVDELVKFKERIDELEEKRQERAEKYREENKKEKEKIEADFVKNTQRKEKDYYRDIKEVDRFKKIVEKQEEANQELATKKRVIANNQIVQEKERLGVATQSQEKRFKDFKVQLDEQRSQHNDFISDLQANEQEKILLASAGLNDYYIGEKQLSVDEELSKKYPEGITEETMESGNSITIKRIKRTGSHVDVYERVFYTWGGTFFYKNGINIAQSLWDKESIEK